MSQYSQDDIEEVGIEVIDAAIASQNGRPETIIKVIDGIKYAITVQEFDEGLA